MTRRFIALILARLESTLEGYKVGRASFPTLTEMPELMRRPDTWWALAGVLLVVWVMMLLERRG